MTLYDGEYKLTTDDLAELAWLAAQGRKALGYDGKRPCEHAADDVLWSLGWCVMGRISPEDRTA